MARSGAMGTEETMDFYELLQISPNAEPETIHRVYRLLAQRFHPDNAQTGNAGRFREIADAYQVLSDPERRAKYDASHAQCREERWKIASSASAENDFEAEQVARLTVLEVLYTQRRLEPNTKGASLLDLEQLTARPREHLEFTVWYLVQKQLVKRSDNSSLLITADGVDDLERDHHQNVQRRRLDAHTYEQSHASAYESPASARNAAHASEYTSSS
jgi:curved DNA-binding protein